MKSMYTTFYVDDERKAMHRQKMLRTHRKPKKMLAISATVPIAGRPLFGSCVASLFSEK